jgi:hypothetical protein
MPMASMVKSSMGISGQAATTLAANTGIVNDHAIGIRDGRTAIRIRRS